MKICQPKLSKKTSQQMSKKISWKYSENVQKISQKMYQKVLPKSAPKSSQKVSPKCSEKYPKNCSKNCLHRIEVNLIICRFHISNQTTVFNNGRLVPCLLWGEEAPLLLSDFWNLTISRFCFLQNKPLYFQMFISKQTIQRQSLAFLLVSRGISFKTNLIISRSYFFCKTNLHQLLG